MATQNLTDQQLAALRPLEQKLKVAVRASEPEKALELAGEIQAIFQNNRKHHRLLRAKLWAFEACLDANRLGYATTGILGVRQLSSKGTRLYLEASSLLAVCYLRQKKIHDAKKLISEVIRSINDIESERTRHQFQKRLINRIEEECILTELIGADGIDMDANEVQEKAVLLLQRNSDDEILMLIGSSVPTPSLRLLSDVRDYSIKQLPPPDRKALPPPEKAEAPKAIGKTTFSILKRIVWKVLCAPDSTIYKLWSKKVPKVFNEGYFSAAVVTALNDFRIGAPMVASGVLALLMKYSAQEFCELAKPKGLMIARDEGEI